MQQPLICIVGPTASGKTALSIALAKHWDTEIISSDSMQIYRGMDIGTAKPDEKERDGVVHHMFDVADPGEDFSVARYQEMADACAQSILAKGKVPIVCGGTGLYLNALIEGNTFSGDESAHEVRDHYRQIVETHGVHYLHELLRQVDPESADRIHENNVKRVIRALEVYDQTGMTIGEFNAAHKPTQPRYRAIMLALCPSDREILYQRINVRVDKMIQQGLVDEASRLYHSGLLTGTAAQAIGYKELLPYLNGEDTLENCVEQLKRASRNYAKRQLTWLRRDSRVTWLHYDCAEDFPELVRRSIEIVADCEVQ